MTSFLGGEKWIKSKFNGKCIAQSVGKKVLTAALAVLFFTAFTAAVASADTITVCPSGCDYTTIQAAVNAASPGDTVFVYSGTYTENVNVNKRLTLQGEGADVVTVTSIHGSGVFYVNVNWVNISGFRATGGYVGIYLNGANHCNISENNASNNIHNGIALGNSSNCVLTNNIANSNNGDAGIGIGESSHNTLTGNTGNLNGIDGIYLSNSSDYNTLTDNTANSNDKDGINLWRSNNNMFTSNTANLNNDDGIDLDESSYNTFADNIANLNGDWGITMWDSSHNTLTSNIANSNGEGICVDESSYNTLTSNIMGGNAYNFYLGGYLYSHFNNTIDTTNSVDGKPICYIKDDSSGIVIDNGTSNAGTIYCIQCDNVTIKDLNLTKNGRGVFFWQTTNSSIENVNASSNDFGILLYSSSNNMLTSNTANSNTYHGIYLYKSSNNTIYNNYFDNTNNAYDDGNNRWNITKTAGTNIIGVPYLGGNYWSDYAGEDLDGDGLGDTLFPYNSSGGIQNGGDYLPLVEPAAPSVFDTGKGTYPSIMGTHKGEIKPSDNVNVSNLYTYPCAGTGGHTESIELYENGDLIASGVWEGYQGDWHNITITPSVTLLTGHTYNYTIVTGSYPQIIHEPSKDVTGGTITCTSFVDANGKTYTDWIPAIRLE